MKRALFASLVLVACGAPASPVASPAPPTATPTGPATPPSTSLPPSVDHDFLRAFTETNRFRRGPPVEPTVTADGKLALFLRSGPRDPRQSLFATDLTTGATRELLSADTVEKGPESLTTEERARRERMRVSAAGFTSFEVSRDGKTVLLLLAGKLVALDLASGQWRALTAARPGAIDPHLSPDATRVAYVAADDLHVIPLAGGADRALTHGGTEAKPHGLAEFVAAEELERARGFWWSPDGQELLYEEADTAAVERFTIADPAHPEREPDRFAYPRPGRTNAAVRFGVVAATGGATRWIDWDHARFPYVARVEWSARRAPLTLVVLDRLQKTEQVLAADPATGKTRVLVEEKDEAWVNVDPSVPAWLDDGSAFLWSSEREGAWRLELHDKSGALARALTPLDAGYASLAHVDAKNRVAYVNDAPDVLHARVERVPLDGSKVTVVASATDGAVTARFGESDDVFVASTTTLAAPETQVARSVDGATSHELPSVAESPRPPLVTLETVGPDGVHAAIVRPRAFADGARTPLIDYAYGGPHANQVTLNEPAYLVAQFMADATGATVVLLDAKGTPGRGRAWERAIAGKLLEVPLEGHVDAIHALVAAHPELDAFRIGVFGWSFGGTFAAGAVLRHPDVYGAGVAIAPVTDWRDYDTAYTERYLGLPDANAAAYDDASPLFWAAKPRPPKDPSLLLAHGTADDNVYFLHSLRLADALERAGRPFTFVPLAGQTHMVATPPVQQALWVRAADALRAALSP